MLRSASAFGRYPASFALVLLLSGAGSQSVPLPEFLVDFCLNHTDNGCHSHAPMPVRSASRLPQLLIVGDSISMGYSPILASKLAGRVDVFHVGQETQNLQNCTGTQPGSGCGVANAGDSCRGFACLVDQHGRNCSGRSCWTTREGDGDTHWDIVLMNFGLHDIEKDRLDPNTTQAIPINDYASLLRNVTMELQTRTDVLIWVSTTPLPRNGTSNRVNSDVVWYNGVALDVMKSVGGVQICDLYSFIVDHCGTDYDACDWQPSPPHFPGHYDPLASFLETCITNVTSKAEI